MRGMWAAAVATCSWQAALHVQVLQTAHLDRGHAPTQRWIQQNLTALHWPQQLPLSKLACTMADKQHNPALHLLKRPPPRQLTLLHQWLYMCAIVSFDLEEGVEWLSQDTCRMIHDTVTGALRLQAVHTHGIDALCNQQHNTVLYNY